MIIYKIENKINGKIYIGQTKNSLNNRVANHFKNESFIGNALRKYGIQSFDVSIIDECSSKEILNEKEQYWIRFYNCGAPLGYNLLPGGSYSIGFSGRQHSEESLRKMRELQSGENNGMYGRKHSEETRRKIGEAEKGFKHSDETKKKMSKTRTGLRWSMSEEGKKRLRHPKSEKGRANIKAAANNPERIAKIKTAIKANWVLRKQKSMIIKEAAGGQANPKDVATIPQG